MQLGRAGDIHENRLPNYPLRCNHSKKLGNADDTLENALLK